MSSPTQNMTSEEDGEGVIRKDQNKPVSTADRIMHFTWPWYLMTMSTGGYAVLLGEQEHTFRGLQTIGKIVFIFDLVVFITITAFITQRFVREPSLFPRSLRNPGESLFIPALLLSLANILICIQLYGVPSTGPWLVTTVRVLFWIYVALAFLLAVFVYMDLFTARRMTDQDIVPAWLLPILPIMLSGTIAGAIAKMQPPAQRMDILVAGTMFQGLGFFAAISLYGPVISRLMRIGLPAPKMRPGMFVAVAPPGFTALAIVNISMAIPSQGVSYFDRHPGAPETLQEAALAFAIFIWAISFWWFSISFVSLLLEPTKISFSLVWYAMIFPNVGFTIATISIGRGLGSSAITWVGSGMTIILTVTYIFILVMHAQAVWRGVILWPGKDEDKNT